MQKKDLIKFSIHPFNNPQQTRSRREVPYSEKGLHFPAGPGVNSLPARAGAQVQPLVREDSSRHGATKLAPRVLSPRTAAAEAWVR